MVWKGLKFGMLLQLAVGPMCLMVFNTSATHGIIDGLTLELAIALIDLLYIALSCMGAASLISRTRVKAAVKLVGCLVLVLFGASTIAGAFKLTLLPNIALFSDATGQSLFIQGLLLTASNPLTIVFWSGMFTTQMFENQWIKQQLFLFAAGCVLSTLIFLTAVTLLGSVLSGFLPELAIQLLNAAVGAFLIFFGLRLLLKKEGKKEALVLKE